MLGLFEPGNCALEQLHNYRDELLGQIDSVNAKQCLLSTAIR